MKDVESKEHPCLLPWSKLPIEQRKKDDLFRQVVRCFAFDKFITVVDAELTEG